MMSVEGQAPTARDTFDQSHGGKRWDREHHAGYDRVVWRLALLLIEQVRRHDPSVVTGHRSQPGGSACRGIAGGVHRRIRHALQVLVDGHSLPIPPHSCGVQIEVVDFWHASRSVHNHVRFHLQRCTPSLGVDHERGPGFLDSRHRSAKSNVYAKDSRPRHEEIDQVWIEGTQRSRAMVHDGHLGAGAGADVTELEGDVPATHEQHARRKGVELHELLARDEMLAALNAQIGRPRARGNEEAPAFEHVITHRDRGGPFEAGSPVKGLDASPRKSVLPLRGHGLDHRSLETHSTLTIQ